MTLFSTRTLLLGVLILTTAGSAFALDCALLAESAPLDTASVTVDGEPSDDARVAREVRATPDGLEVIFGEGEDAVVLGFDRIMDGAQ